MANCTTPYDTIATQSPHRSGTGGGGGNAPVATKSSGSGNENGGGGERGGEEAEAGWTKEDEENLHCLCRLPADTARFRTLMKCDLCASWFHPACVRLKVGGLVASRGLRGMKSAVVVRSTLCIRW